MRKLGVGVGLVAIAIALVLWRCGATTNTAKTGTGQAASTTTSIPQVGVVAKPKVDPRTQAKGSIAGTVRDAKGAALANATVCLSLTSDDLPPDFWPHPVCKRTAATGAYAFPDLVPASYRVRAGAPKFRFATFHPGGDRHRSKLDLHPGEARTGVDFALVAGGVEVTGVVNDLTGGPIAHARVAARTGRWGRGETSPSVETDEAGKFSLWAPAGPVIISAAADGYAPADVSTDAPGTVELFLSPESSLAGLVVDARTEKPLANVDVFVSRVGEWDSAGQQGTRSNDKGEFKVASLTPGRYAATVQSAAGYGRSTGSVLVGLGQSVDGVVVKVWPTAKLLATVTLATTKKPCPDASLWLHDDVQDLWIGGEADDDGTIEITGARPGTYKPRPSCEGFQPRDEYPVVVVADKDLTGLVYEVDEGASIVGRVTTKSGEPVADAQIMARSVDLGQQQRDAWGQDTSQPDGSYELRGLHPYTFKLSVDSERGIPASEELKVKAVAGAKVTADIVLEDGGTLVGSVVDAEGKPVADVSVLASPVAERVRWTGGDRGKTDATGAFTIPALRPGEYRVYATRGDWESMKKPGTTDDDSQGEAVAIAAGKSASVKLVIESQAGTISGTVIDAAGKPVTDAFLSSVRESDAAGANRSSVAGTRGWGGWMSDEQPVLTSTEGTFTLTKLSPGTYTVRAYRKGGGEAVSEHIAVGTKTAKLQIKDTGTISGTVASSGAPLADEVKIDVADLKSGFLRSETFYRSGGAFTVSDLPAGHFKITAASAGSQGAAELDLAVGETKSGVTIALQALLTITGRLVDMQTKEPVAGIRVLAQVAQGDTFSFGWNDDQDNISDASGSFTVKRAPKAKLAIQGMPRDPETSDYSWFRQVRDVSQATTSTVSVGDIALVKKRLKTGDVAGDLGLNFKQFPPETPQDEVPIQVSFIEPAGPAAKTEIKVGDVIVSVDGVDATHGGLMNAWTMLQAPVGTVITLGLARGVAVKVTLGPPR